LVARVEERLEGSVECPRGAGSHDDVFEVKIEAGTLGQMGGDGRPYFRKSGIRHIAVAMRPALGNHLSQCFEHGGRWFYLGIPQREIKNVFGSPFPAELDADFKHAANPAGSLHLLRDGLRNDVLRSRQAHDVTALTAPRL